ncbi:MAG: Uma2 family endonuclease [Candidatus Binatia bacterium]
MIDTAERDPGFDVDTYFELVGRGLLTEDDHVELLEGLVVASPPQGPLHASVTMDFFVALERAVGGRAAVRIQMPLVVGPRSVPEPDVALVPGTSGDYRRRHPDQALLVVEISDSSLPQDRLTKSRIYARAGIPEYWIVNLRDRCVEVHSKPDTERRLFAAVRTVRPGDLIDLVTLAGARVAVSELLQDY